VAGRLKRSISHSLCVLFGLFVDLSDANICVSIINHYTKVFLLLFFIIHVFLFLWPVGHSLIRSVCFIFFKYSYQLLLIGFNICQQDDTLRKAVGAFNGRNWKKIGCLFFPLYYYTLLSIQNYELLFHTYFPLAIYFMTT
jgi:hypothetical protein